MKKIKTRKEILTSPEFNELLFELLKEEGYGCCVDDYLRIADDEEIECRIKFFIERKLLVI